MAEASSLRVQPREPRAAATLNQILDAAVIVLNRTGRDAFAMQSIAAESGVAVGTLYRYFPNRKALLDYLWPDRRDSFLPEGHFVPYVEVEGSGRSRGK